MSVPGPSGDLALPKTPQDVLRLIELSSSLELIGSTLIPTLHALTAPSSSAGGKSRQRTASDDHKGEELLSSVLDNLVGDAVKLQRYTAAIVYALSARLHRAKKGATPQKRSLLQLAMRFFGVADPQQLSMCRQRESSLAWGALRLAQSLKCVPDVVRPLFNLVSNPPPMSRLRPGHAALLEACLLARDFRPLGSIPFESISLDPGNHGLHYLDVLTFLHHAGLANAALHQYRAARDFFVAAVSAPTQSASAIQLAAAKRAILCDLLVLSGEKDRRKVSLFPQYTSSSVHRIIERQAERYTALQKAIEGKNWSSAREIASSPDFAEDMNGTLIQLVLQSISARRTLDIRHTYSRLSLVALASKIELPASTGADQVKAVISDLVQTGLLRADISTLASGEEVVLFQDAPEDISPTVSIPAEPTHSRMGDMQGRSHQNQMLEYKLSTMSKQMALTPAYLKKQSDRANLTGGRSGRGRDDMDMMDVELLGAKRGAGVGANWADTGY